MTLRTLAALTVAATGLAAATPAHATDGLAWQWDVGQARSYHLMGQILLPEFHWLRAFANDEVRINEARIEMVVTCKGHEPAGKKAMEVRCHIDDFALQVVTIPGDKGRAQVILDEWDERLTGSDLEIVWTYDGRIQDLGYVDSARRNRRDGDNLEYMRQLLLRAFSPLDLRMPKNGTDKGEGAWVEKAPLVMAFPSTSGSVGTVKLQHQVAAEKGGKVKLQSAGEGTMASAASTTEVAGNEEISNFYQMALTSEAMFDTQKGELVSRQVAAQGNPTASSQLSDGYGGLPYVQAYRVSLLSEGAPPPMLPESKEVDAVFTP